MPQMIKKLYDYYLASGGVTTDSRHVPVNSIFFALKGAHFDGNRYAKEALAKGARYVVIDDPAYKDGKAYILVNDVLETLQQLAAYHRSRMHIPVLALSGSNGKTTTKELLRSALSQAYRVHATKGNLNNHIGVPLTLLAMPRDAEMAIIEMGASGPGEIKKLCEIACPNYGLITNVGEAHLEGFGGPEGVIKAKKELYDFLAENDGVAFYNTDEAFLAEMCSHVNKRIGYGTQLAGPGEAFILVQSVQKKNKVVALVPETGWSFRVFSRLAGAHNFENVKTAIAVAKYFKLNFAQIKMGIEVYWPDNMRSQLLDKGDYFVFLDAYNANPSSMQQAIDAFMALEVLRKMKKVAVLGDMLELGEYAEEGHRKILQHAEAAGFEEILLVGSRFATADEAGKYPHFEDVSGLVHFLNTLPHEGIAFFVKGSRSMSLEAAFLR